MVFTYLWVLYAIENKEGYLFIVHDLHFAHISYFTLHFVQKIFFIQEYLKTTCAKQEIIRWSDLKRVLAIRKEMSAIYKKLRKSYSDKQKFLGLRTLEERKIS